MNQPPKVGCRDLLCQASREIAVPKGYGASETSVTELLNAWSKGDRSAQDQLFDVIYPQLRRLARSRMRAEHQALSIQPTDLVHEAFVQLVNQRQVSWQSRGHFFAIAAVLIRRILIDRARWKQRSKRGSGVPHIQMDTLDDLPCSEISLDLLALDSALSELAQQTLTAARVVDLRFFAGLSVNETAKTMGVSRQTVVCKWRFARAFLATRLGRGS